jgi:hypothetical protein
MKVWELITELMKYPAGNEVFVGTPYTQYAAIIDVCKVDDGEVGIDAEQSQCVNDDGDEIGMLSSVVNGN